MQWITTEATTNPSGPICRNGPQIYTAGSEFLVGCAWTQFGLGLVGASLTQPIKQSVLEFKLALVDVPKT